MTNVRMAVVLVVAATTAATACYGPPSTVTQDAAPDASDVDAVVDLPDASQLRPGIVVSPVVGSTTEKGQTATFTVVLQTTPSADVLLKLESNNTSEAVTNITMLRFSPSAALTPQTVSISGVDDGIADGDTPYRIVFAQSQSADLRYAAIQPNDLRLSNIDNGAVTVCAMAEEYLSATLNCPVGRSIAEINFASYGTPEGSCGGYTVGACHADTSAAIVTDKCASQASCVVAADNAVFDDPCITVGKRLYIQATCR